MNAHKEAFLARQAGPPAMEDGLVETAGLPDDEDYTAEEETDEILSDDETVAAIEEGVDDLESEDDESELNEDDTITALDDMTIPQLKELADSRSIEYPSDIHKADLVELIASS